MLWMEFFEMPQDIENGMQSWLVACVNVADEIWNSCNMSFKILMSTHWNKRWKTSFYLVITDNEHKFRRNNNNLCKRTKVRFM